jgi:predicted Rossmann fold nucleotide-binding protein DprA/Smf involved in DNA uptake
MDMHGNSHLMGVPKTAFLCSRDISASAVLKCYDWAIEQRERGRCVVSGFQSKIEKDVLHYLIQGSQPLVIVLARGMRKRLEQELQGALNKNRLLILSPFDDSIRRVTAETAEKRNRMMMEIADEIVFGHISDGGMLSRLRQDFKDKKITML